MQTASLQGVVIGATLLTSGFLDLFSDLVRTVDFEISAHHIIVNPTLDRDDPVIGVGHIVHLLHLAFDVDDIGERYLDPSKIVSLVDEFG